MYISHFDNIRIQTVKEHNLNVSNLTELYASKINFSSTGKLIGYLHDIGKYSNNFQKYINLVIEHTKNGDVDNFLKTTKVIDHGKVGAMLLYDKYHLGNTIKETYVEILSSIIMYHHGGLNDFVSLDGRYNTPFYNRINSYQTDEDYISVKDEFNKEIDCNLIDKLFHEGLLEYENYLNKIKNKDNHNEYIFFLILYLYSCLIDADRLDTQSFMDNIKIEKLNTIKSTDMLLKLNKFHDNLIINSKQTKINKLRNNIYEECCEFAKKKTGCYTLTVPTGGGKTISSLAYALNHMKNFKKERIIYVLPFTSIIEQNSDVFRTILGKENVLEYHSNVLNENKNIFSVFRTKYSEEDAQKITYNLLTHRWDSSIIVTTLVQFLNTLLSTGTQNIRRLHNLSNSIIIFDEIQSLPVKCIGIFSIFVNFLKEICNSTIVLCSATQPAFNKINYSNPKYQKFLLDIDGEIISNPQKYYKEFRRVNVVNQMLADGYDEQNFKKFVYSIMEKYNNLLIIMNTKKTAEKVYDLFSSSSKFDKIYYLSTNLCAKHRNRIIKQVKLDLKNKKRILLVSTQLIEAGVDISFECAIRNLSGASSIAQSAGRCNRNGEAKTGTTYIINIAEEKLGSLTDIKDGEDIVSNIYKMNPKIDLLSLDTIDDYYIKFHGRKDDRLLLYQLDCEIKENNTICEQFILDKNLYIKAKRNLKTDSSNFNIITYPFRTIFSNFHVINNNMVSVLTPYEDGEKIVAELYSSKSIYEKIKILENMQPYLINIDKNKFEKFLEKNIINKTEIDGLYILNQLYYDDKKGLTETPKFSSLIF